MNNELKKYLAGETMDETCNCGVDHGSAEKNIAPSVVEGDEKASVAAVSAEAQDAAVKTYLSMCEDEKMVDFGIEKTDAYKEHAKENNYLDIKKGDIVQIKNGIRCLESGKTCRVMSLKWPIAVFQNEDNGKTWQGYVNSFVDKVLPGDDEKDPEAYIREFKDKMGYRDGYDPSITYEEICDRLAREYTLESPTDTEAREVEGDAVMMLLRGAKTDRDRKTAYELGDILMGEKNGGHRNKDLLKKIREAFLAMNGRDM